MVAPRVLLFIACAAFFCALAHCQEKPLPEARSIDSVSSNYTLPFSTNTADVSFDVVDRYMSLIPSANTAFFARKMSVGDILIGFTTVDKNFAGDTNFAVVSSDISRPSFRTCSPASSSSQAYLQCDIAPASGALKDHALMEARQFAASLGSWQPSLNISCDVLTATSYTYAAGQSDGIRHSIVNCLIEVPQSLSHAVPPTARSDITATFIMQWAPPVGSVYSSISSTRLVNLRRGSAPFFGGLWKMPAVAEPSFYELDINPEKDMTESNPYIFTSFIFAVNNKITLRPTAPSKFLFLHAADIRATAAQIVSGSSLSVTDVIYAPDLELSIVVLSGVLQPSSTNIVLSINNIGVLNDDMRGFYRSKEDAHNVNSPWIATTQFESTDARRTFFCVDEPAAKAQFQISITAPRGLTVLSNMDYSTTTPKPVPVGSSLLLHKFAPSVKMSSYLVAFVIGNFVSLENTVTQAKTTHQGQPAPVLVRLWGTPANAAKLQYALDAASTMIVHFSKVFDFQFPISKCDFIAIPDFSAGAMENWGLITYRETALLIDPLTATISNKQRVALVISHELVHQWFGDLVTAQWWSELWLNEGFATYFEYEGMDSFVPEWKIFKDFNYNDRAGALAFDSSLGTHALSNFQPGPWSPGEIGSMFDSISYDKGGTVLRMANAWLTGGVTNPAPGAAPSRFMDGLRSYLLNKQYKPASFNDMWTTMNAPFPFDPDFSSKMTNWTTSPGFPLVSVSASDNKIILSARPYTPATYNSMVEAPVWWIPVTYTVSSTGAVVPVTIKTSFMSNTQLVITVSGQINWIQVNGNGYGAYRTVYSDRLLSGLLDNALSKQLLSTNDITSLVDDMYNFMSLNSSDSTSAFQSLTSTMRVLQAVVQSISNYALAASVKPARLLLDSGSHAASTHSSGMSVRLSDGSGAEELFQAWRAVLNTLLKIHNRLEGWPLQQRVKTVLLRLSSSISNLVSLNTVKQPHGFQYLASLAFTMAVKFGDTPTIAKLSELFDRYFDTATSRMNPGLDPNLRETVFFAAATTKERYPLLVKMLSTTADAAETVRIIRAISEFPTSKENMRATLELSLDSFKIRKQDASFVLSYVSQNINGGLDAAWQFTADHWSYFMSNALFGTSRIVGIAAAYANQSALDRVRTFFNAHPVDGLQGSYRRVLGRISDNLAWARNANAESTTVAPVITKILILAETIGMDDSLLNAPPPPQRPPPDYTAGSIVAAIALSGLLLWVAFKTVRQVKLRYQRGNRFTKFDDINEFGFPVRGVNVARDYQGDDAVDTGFVDQSPRSGSVSNDQL